MPKMVKIGPAGPDRERDEMGRSDLGYLLFLPARRYASAGNSDRNVSVRPSVRLSVRLSRAGIVSRGPQTSVGPKNSAIF